MQMHESDLVDRITQLEKQNRMLKRVGAVVGALLVALFATGQAQSPRAIEANEFVLKDKAGVVRARLYMEDKTQPALYFYGPNNALPLALKGGDEPAVVLNRAGTNEQVLITANRKFFGMVLYDEKSHRAALSVEDGTPGLDFYDQESKPQASIFALASRPVIRLYSTKASSSVELFASESNSGLEFVGPVGQATLGLREQNAGPHLELRDKGGYSAVLGNTSLVAPRTGKTENTSAASLVLFDKDGKVLSSVP